MTNCGESLHDIRDIDSLVKMGEGTKVKVSKEGSMRAAVVVDGVKKNVFMEDFYFVPDLMASLVSVIRLRKKRIDTYFTGDPDNFGNGMV